MNGLRAFLGKAAFWEGAFLAFLFVAALALRLYKLHEPLADWHSFRQADTASVTREYVKHGIDILRPQYHDLSNIQSGEDNLEGWRMVEFPVVNAAVATALRAAPSWNEVVVSRVFSVGASLFSLIAFWFVVRSVFGRALALASASVFALMPYAVFYSRVILPEPFLVLFLLLTLAFLVLWSRWAPRLRLGAPDLFLILAAVTWSLALLLKPMALFYAPIFLAVVWHWRRFSLLDLIRLGLLFCLGLIPLWLWRDWITHFPSGIPASDWLFNSNNIRLRPAWWRWLFADRLGRLMLGHWGTAFFALGGLAALWQFTWPKMGKNHFHNLKRFFVSLERLFQQEGMVLFGLVSFFSYLIIIATGNVQHDYYQAMLVPIISLVVARGVVWLWRFAPSLWHKCVTFLTLGAIAGLSWYFAFYEVKGWYQINNPAIVSAGEAVQRLTPENALIIAPYFGDTSFLYQTSRRGWPIGFEIDDKIAKGAQFYVTTSQDDEANMLMRQYVVLEQTPEYILIDLQQPLPATGSALKR